MNSDNESDCEIHREFQRAEKADRFASKAINILKEQNMNLGVKSTNIKK